MDFLKIFVVISFLIVTVLTLKFHPKMHLPLIIEDENFKLTRISDTISTKNIPINPTLNNQNSQNNQEQIEVNIQQQPIQQEQTKYVSSGNTNPIQNEKEVKYNTNQNENISQIELLQYLLNEVEKEYNKQTNQPQQNTEQQVNTQNSTTGNLKNPSLTEQEEIIAWNRWRSNVHNQIMRDSNIAYAPIGTMFSFNFVVDKFGNISNIKVDCSDPNYMDIARYNVKKAITKLQNQPILNFPKGTQRKSTVVQGYFFIGFEERYSTPSNFSDYERVTY